jgi:hypothetical protein
MMQNLVDECGAPRGLLEIGVSTLGETESLAATRIVETGPAA